MLIVVIPLTTRPIAYPASELINSLDCFNISYRPYSMSGLPIEAPIAEEFVSSTST